MGLDAERKNVFIFCKSSGNIATCQKSAKMSMESFQFLNKIILLSNAQKNTSSKLAFVSYYRKPAHLNINIHLFSFLYDIPYIIFIFYLSRPRPLFKLICAVFSCEKLKEKRNVLLNGFDKNSMPCIAIVSNPVYRILDNHLIVPLKLQSFVGDLDSQALCSLQLPLPQRFGAFALRSANNSRSGAWERQRDAGCEYRNFKNGNQLGHCFKGIFEVQVGSCLTNE